MNIEDYNKAAAELKEFNAWAARIQHERLIVQLTIVCDTLDFVLKMLHLIEQCGKVQAELIQKKGSAKWPRLPITYPYPFAE